MRFCQIFGTAFFAIPFYFLWNYLAPIYLATLPAIYLAIPFWHCVALFLLIGVVKAAVFPHRGWHYGWHHGCGHGFKRFGKWKSYA